MVYAKKWFLNGWDHNWNAISQPKSVSEPPLYSGPACKVIQLCNQEPNLESIPVLNCCYFLFLLRIMLKDRQDSARENITSKENESFNKIKTNGSAINWSILSKSSL